MTKRGQSKDPEYLARGRAYYEANKGQFILEARISQLRNEYGITVEEFNTLVKEAAGRCMICLTETTLDLDHDHERKTPRGLLCRPCNTGLGVFQDDPSRLQAAIEYLRRFQDESSR